MNETFNVEKEGKNSKKKHLLIALTILLLLTLFIGGTVILANKANENRGPQITEQEQKERTEAETEKEERQAELRANAGKFDTGVTTLKDDQTWLQEFPNPAKLEQWQKTSRSELKETEATKTNNKNNTDNNKTNKNNADNNSDSKSADNDKNGADNDKNNVDSNSDSKGDSTAVSGSDSGDVVTGDVLDHDTLDALSQQRVDWFMEVDGVQAAMASLPSRASGFTENPDLMMTDEGMNPMYSYWTAEGFVSAVSDFTSRYLNSIYGEWSQVQFDNFGIDGFLTERFRDMYDPDYLATVIDTPTRDWIPVYADWDGDNYGGLNLTDVAGRWIGTPTNVTVKFNDNLTEATVTVDAEFTAWTVEKETLKRDAVLTYTVVQGNETQHYMVKDASLEVSEK